MNHPTMTRVVVALLVFVTALCGTTPSLHAQARMFPSDKTARQGTSVEMVQGRVFVPPAGYRVEHECNGSIDTCDYWLTEKDTLYDQAVYAAWVLWMSALALAGLGACLLVMFAVYGMSRDILRPRRKPKPAAAQA